jgi:antitoxin HicB
MGSAQPFAESPDRADTVFRARGTDWRRARFYKENTEDAAGRDRISSETNEGNDNMSEKNQHWGSTLDDFLREEGIYEAAKAEAVMRVISWQIAEEMRKRGMTKTQMAEQMHTSRAQVDRILKAKGNVTIETLQRAAALVGRELRLELV